MDLHPQVIDDPFVPSAMGRTVGEPARGEHSRGTRRTGHGRPDAGNVAPMGAKITLVGGGSTHWTPKLTVDFANTPALTDAELVLYDLDPDSLPPALKVVEHVAERRGIPLTARATTDIDDAVERSRIRHRHLLGRWVRQHAPRHRDPDPLRDTPDRR